MKDLIIENARIIYRNFAGQERGKYNPEGRRNFSVLLEEDLATSLQKEGWYVKPLNRRDENDPQRYHIPVAVVFAKYPPKIILLRGAEKIWMSEKTVYELDWLEFTNIDLILHPREWEPGRVKAYLKCGYFTAYENALDKKYADYTPIEDSDDMPF